MSKYRDSQSLDCKVYVGELGSNASKKDLEEAFGHYGPLRSVWVARNPPGFAFVQFEDSRDAEDAVRGLDGRTVCGRRIRVEMSSGKTRKKHFNNHDDRYPKRRRGDGDQYADDGYQNKRYRRSPSPKRRASRSRSRSRGRRSESPGQSRRYSRSRSRSPN